MYAVGDRLGLLEMVDEKDPVPPGTRGTVVACLRYTQQEWLISMEWDNGRTLSLIVPGDRVVRVCAADDWD